MECQIPTKEALRMEFHFDLPMCKSIIARHTYTYTLYLIGEKRDFFFTSHLFTLSLKVVQKRFWLLKIGAVKLIDGCSKMADFPRACVVVGKQNKL